MYIALHKCSCVYVLSSMMKGLKAVALIAWRTIFTWSLGFLAAINHSQNPEHTSCRHTIGWTQGLLTGHAPTCPQAVRLKAYQGTVWWLDYQSHAKLGGTHQLVTPDQIWGAWSCWGAWACQPASQHTWQTLTARTQRTAKAMKISQSGTFVHCKTQI